MPPGRAPQGSKRARAESPGEPSDDIQGTNAGATIQLGEDFLVYVRQRFDAAEFKDELVRRLLPTVPRSGRPARVAVGATFGKFQLEAELGKGGMAVVYKALDPERGSGSDYGPAARRSPHVALKVMKDELALDPAYVRRFLREAANAALIDHRNVVRVHELGAVAGRLYFTMELIEGETLKDTLARGPLPEDEGVQVLCQLLDGLVAAHARGIGHRDLKPANVMLVGPRHGGLALEGEDGAFDVTVKITDFGLAQMLETDSADQMPEGHFLGTAKYIAPEVIKGGEPTLKSDVFSIGILAYQLFAGRPPWQGRTKLDYVTANLTAEAPRLDALCRCSKDLARIARSMLEKDPSARPDAATLRGELGKLVARRARGGAPSEVGPALAAGGAAALLRRPAALGGAAAAVGLLAALGLALGRDPRPPVAPPPPPTTARPDTAAPPPTTTSAPPPQTVGGAGGLDPIPLPPPRAFADQQARLDFGRAVERGDAAWARGEPGEALAQWERAQAMTRAPAPLLEARLREARPAARLALADAAEREGDLERALREVEAAAAEGAAAAEVARRRGRLEDRRGREDALAAGLREAQAAWDAGRRDEARAALAALEGLARDLGQAERLEAKWARFGGRGGAPATEPGPAPATEAPRGEAQGLLDRAEEELRAGRLESAERALALARKAGGAEARAGALATRLARARATPPERAYLELEPARPEEAPRAVYARTLPVTNRELAAWLARAGSRFAPPQGWRGASAPPPGAEDAPVLGVDGATARAFAEAAGERLPDAAERAALRARAGEADAAVGEPTDLPGRPRDGAPEARGRYERGFFTVRDAAGP